MNQLNDRIKDSSAALAFFMSSAAWTIAPEDLEVPDAGLTARCADRAVFSEA